MNKFHLPNLSILEFRKIEGKNSKVSYVRTETWLVDCMLG